ncbi:MAG: N-acetylmuramoyl-L-alanine amidase [Alphaproteobacteria bacterium]|nr:N-acetylmuramoyl-L-alanine amidase [Alphaproteobacteria bacterium]
MLKRFLALLLFMGISLSSAWAQTIQDLRIGVSDSQNVRFVVDISGQASIKLSHLSNPPRMVIDVKDAPFAACVQNKKYKKTGFVSNIRTGKPENNISRIVLDLATSEFSEKHFTLAPQPGAPWRFVIDLTAKMPQVSVKAFSNDAQSVATVTPAPKPVVTPAPTTTEQTKPAPVQEQPKQQTKKSVTRKKIVMLDPGHGGQDPGAISRSGKYEKTLTLNMAKETKTLLEKAGYKVVMTRDRDVYVTLRGRIEKAHKANADLFISIHADSASSSSAKGLSVYTISEKASDKEAAALAESANKADILFGMDLSEYQPEVGNILIDFAKTYTMDQSAKYADEVVKEMAKEVTLRPKAHRYAGFAVLKSPNVPSVLLEMGYLSNKEEDKLLQKESYRNKLSKALVRAVNTYFAKHVEQ